MYDPDDQISFTLRAMQLTENRRSDVVVLNFFRTYWGYRQIVERWPDLLPPLPVRSGQELERLFWTYSLQRRPFFADLPVKISAPQSYRVEGLVYRILPKAEPAMAPDLARVEAFYPLYVWRGTWRTTDQPDFFIRQIFNYYAAARCNLGLQYAERHLWSAAMVHYQQALCVDPHLAAAYNDLGVVYFEQRLYSLAVKNYQLAVRFEPENIAYRQNLALAYQQNGQITQAQVLLQASPASTNHP